MSATVKHKLSLLVALSLFSLATLPSAHASKLYIETPNFSFGIKDHDRHYDRRHRNDNRYNNYRANRKHDRHHRRHNKPRYGYDYYYGSPRYAYPRKHPRANSRQYYSYRTPYRDQYRYSSRTYRNSICPTAGYSPYYYQDSNCSRHKDHFHCN